MAVQKILVPPVGNRSLESDLWAKLRPSGDSRGPLGPLELLAVRLGLIQSKPAPSFSTPSLVVFAADHGLAVDNIAGDETRTTAALVHAILSEQLPLASLARQNGFRLMLVDSGIAEPVAAHEHFHARKIAHGTRNARSSKAMSLEQAQAAIRAGIEIGESLEGDAVACAGIGVGAMQSAALVLSALSEVPLWEFVDAGPAMPVGLLDHTLRVLESARQRHIELLDPIEVLAAMGGFEVAMMVGLMLSASARRFTILPDGLSACAALMVASTMAPAVVDYCIHCRSSRHPGLDRALSLFDGRALLQLSTNEIDGTAATLSWPMVLSAAALLSATG